MLIKNLQGADYEETDNRNGPLLCVVSILL